MTSPLAGQRSRGELIAELYERYAAGLYAYSHDQLGESASAAEAVVAVFTNLPADRETRADLYTLARREIHRRDTSYALPAVDSATDPATALIERVFRDIRSHQREVLLLSTVCGLTTDELSQVLDVAPDTAADLTTAARRRFTQTLRTAVTAARSAPYVAPTVAEVYEAIAVAPIEDVLARLPWHGPPTGVWDRVLSTLPEEPTSTAGASGTTVTASGLPTKKLWPTPPVWPLPLSSPDQVSNTCVVQTDALATEPEPRPRHEAVTQPMPKVRDTLTKRSEPYRTSTTPATAVPSRASTTSTGESSRTPPTSATAEPFDAFSPAVEPARASASPTARPASTALSTSAVTAPPTTTPSTTPASDTPTSDTPASDTSRPASSSPSARKIRIFRRTNGTKPAGNRERHYDWLWEVAGFLICLGIALLVFFALPT